MSKVTSTVLDIFQGEMNNNQGENEFVNFVDGVPQLTALGRNDFAYIRRLVNFDDVTYNAVTNVFFSGFNFGNKELDRFFKRAFVNRFANNEIKFQTVDIFANKLASWCLINEQYMEELYINAKKFYENEHTGETHDKTVDDNVNRSGYNNGNATLPQDKVNLDLTADTMEYADDNTVYRAFNNTTDTNTNDHTELYHSFDAGVFDAMKDKWEELFNQLYKKLFLHVFG